MTDTTVTATNVMNAPAGSLTPEQAVARMEARRTDPDFMARVAAKDAVAFEEYNRDWRVARGMSAEPGVPQTVADVYQAQGERGVAVAEAHADVIERNYDVTDRQLFEITMGRPVQQHEKVKAEIEMQKFQRDEAFMQKWRSGDRVARTTMYLLNCMKVAPAATLEQVLQWDVAHPFTPRSG